MEIPKCYKSDQEILTVTDAETLRKLLDEKPENYLYHLPNTFIEKTLEKVWKSWRNRRFLLHYGNLMVAWYTEDNRTYYVAVTTREGNEYFIPDGIGLTWKYTHTPLRAVLAMKFKNHEWRIYWDYNYEVAEGLIGSKYWVQFYNHYERNEKNYPQYETVKKALERKT